MPHHNFASQKGKLFVTFKVQLPKKLSTKQKEGLLLFGALTLQRCA
jgi:DnaJ-class molecular chaperone